MPDFTFGPAPVLVETTGEFAIGATGVLRATESGDPVAVYDLNGSALPSVAVGPKGAHQAFKADIPNGVLDFGSVLLPKISDEAQVAALTAAGDAAQALDTAQQAIEDSASAAASAAVAAAAASASAALVSAPADAAVAALVSGGTSTRTAMDARYTTKGAIFYNAKDYGAVGNGTTDDGPAIQAALNAAETAGTGTVYLPVPAGHYRTNQQLLVPNKVELVGVGREVRVVAGPSFPANTALVRLGRGGSIVFGCRVRNLTLDCNGATNSTCIYSTEANEQSGVFNTVVAGFTVYGIHFVGASIINIEDSEVYPAAAGGTTGIYLDNVAGDNLIKRVTLGVSGPLGTGIHAQLSQVIMVGVHIETCTIGVDLNECACSIVGISGPSTSPAVPTLIRARGNTRYNSALGIAKGNSTAAVSDEFFGYTLTDSYIPSWTGGDNAFARLRHVGDRAGFFGTTPIGKPTVTGSRGGNAALASLLAAFAALGAVTDNTTS